MVETAARSLEVPQAYRVHPLLDPRLPSHDRGLARVWVAVWRKLFQEPDAAGRMLASYSRPAGSASPAPLPIEIHYRDADLYLDDLLRLVPDSLSRHLEPLARTRRLNAMIELFRAVFEGTDARTRYEAQRKLYLGKLLFDIEHCRSVRDGPHHRQRFESVLSEGLWSGTEEGGEVQICCRLVRDPKGAERFEVGVAPAAGVRCYGFQLRRLRPSEGEAAIDVFHYRSRLKREANPAPPTRGEDGLLELAEEARWPALGGRNGSILSKMIRRGITHPSAVEDMLGAMFIVGDRRQAYALERRLLSVLGGPLRWRDRVDTLSGQRGRERLGPSSSSGFQILKAIVDVLAEDPADESPYLFPVEVQIYTIEAYLRTLHDEHFASHTAYKRRQFLRDLIPLLFPREVYGEETLLLGGTAGG
jgi:hypothetical protein